VEATEVTLRWIIGAACVISTLLPGSTAGQHQSSRLKDIAYAVHDTVSKMTFAFEGPATYSAARSGHALVITFSGMRADKRLHGVRRLAEKGMIRSIAVTPQPDEVVAVTVNMGDSARYRIVHAQSPRTFSLEVLGRAPVTVQKKKPSAPFKTAVVQSSVAPRSGRAVVDIVGIARGQMEQESHTAATVKGTPTMNIGHPPAAASLLLAAVVGFPLVTGMAILMLMYYRKRKRRLVLARVETPLNIEPVVEEPAVALVEVPVLEQSAMIEAPLLAAAIETVDVQCAANEQSFQIAQSMLQGNEQADLARRFAGETSELTRNRIRKACATKTARTHRMRVAKRLGVGKGEVELAIKLRDIAARRPRKEKKR
jgi:hypothetical protein